MDLWIEKYRPTTLDDVILDQANIEKFKLFVEQKSIPHLLFTGSPGLGKTTCAKIIARSITDKSDILYINASDETSIETIRGKVKSFCSTMSFSEMRIVILDEFDGMTSFAMDMLRNTLEEFNKTCRFILTCNYIEKVSLPIRSRCQVFDFGKNNENKSIIGKRCLDILSKENITLPNGREGAVEDIKSIIKKCYPDIRRIIGVLHQSSITGSFKFDENKMAFTKSQDLLIQCIVEKDYKKIVKELLGAGVDYRELYNTIFDRTSDIAGDDLDKRIQIMMLTADRMRHHALCIDQEMNFKDLILNIIYRVM